MSNFVPALFWLVACAANPATAAGHDSEAQAQPDVVFEETVHDFGSVFSEEGYTHRFRFRSPAGLAVTVTKVAAPCKCTAAVVRLPDAGAGRKWGEIEVKVNFGKGDGAESKRVDVYLVTGEPAAGEKGAAPASADGMQTAQKGGATDDISVRKEHVAAEKTPEKKEAAEKGDAKRKKREPRVVALTLKAFVIQRGIRLRPARLVVGALKRDARVVKKVRAEIVTRFALAEATKVCCSAPWIHASVKEAPAEKDKRRAIAQVSAYELVVTLDAAKARRGRSFLEFVTLYTNAARWPFVDLPIKGRVEK